MGRNFCVEEARLGSCEGREEARERCGRKIKHTRDMRHQQQSISWDNLGTMGLDC